MKKWKNLKDNYMRNVRKQKKSGSAAKKKKYIYAEELSFLNCPEEDIATESSIDVDDVGDGLHADTLEQQEDGNIFDNRSSTPLETEEGVVTTAAVPVAPSSSESQRFSIPREPAKRKRVLEETMINFMRSPQDRPDEDQSFFDSLLPMVRQFDVDQKLEFRTQVMSVIQNMRRKSHTMQFSMPRTTNVMNNLQSQQPHTSFQPFNNLCPVNTNYFPQYTDTQSSSSYVSNSPSTATPPASFENATYLNNFPNDKNENAYSQNIRTSTLRNSQ